MTLQYKIFESTTRSWDVLCTRASNFVKTIPHDRVLNISMAAEGGAELGGAGANGIIIVWYWSE